MSGPVEWVLTIQSPKTTVRGIVEGMGRISRVRLDPPQAMIHKLAFAGVPQVLAGTGPWSGDVRVAQGQWVDVDVGFRRGQGAPSVRVIVTIERSDRLTRLGLLEPTATTHTPKKDI